MEFSLGQVASALGLSLSSRARVTGWSIDSRTIAPGDLFFALRGPNHDGNLYVEEVLRKGAVAAIAGASIPSRDRQEAVLAVPDTLVALQDTAIWALGQWRGDVIGVTGSAGKTSSKDVIASLLSASVPTGKTIGNLNNHVGVPLSILRLPQEARVAVLEMGMNHAGEIRELGRIAKPRIGVVTNVGHAHIEAFDSIEGIARAKRELVESLPPDGIAVLNADDPLASRFGEVHAGRTVTFGLSPSADFRAEDLAFNDDGVTFTVQGVRMQTSLLGRHSVLNILAGIAVASLYGIQPAQLTEAVKKLQTPSMRGERLVHEGIVILNDCYNSNPDAARAMIDLLRDTPATRRIAVLGEMLELGRWSEALHREVGCYVARSGIDVLVGIRGEACHLVDAARQAGLAVNAAFFYPDAAIAGEKLRDIARPGDVMLFKGSRGVHVELALERFLARPKEPAKGGEAPTIH